MNVTSADLKQIIFNEAIRKVHEQYGLYNQVYIFGTDVSTLMLAPKNNSIYDNNDIEFLTECIRAECEL